MFRKEFWKKNQGFRKWVDYGGGCRHLGKLSRSVHGKLPIERHFLLKRGQSTRRMFLRKIFFNCYAWLELLLPCWPVV